MTPSRPAAVVSIACARPLDRTPPAQRRREPILSPLHARRTTRKRGEADDHIFPLNPEFFFLTLAKIHREDYARAAGTASGDPEIRGIVPAAVRTPIFHELAE